MNLQTWWKTVATKASHAEAESNRAYRGVAMANETPAELVWEPWALDVRMFVAANALIVAFALFLLLLTCGRL